MEERVTHLLWRPFRSVRDSRLLLASCVPAPCFCGLPVCAARERRVGQDEGRADDHEVPARRLRRERDRRPGRQYLVPRRRLSSAGSRTAERSPSSEKGSGVWSPITAGPDGDLWFIGADAVDRADHPARESDRVPKRTQRPDQRHHRRARRQSLVHARAVQARGTSLVPDRLGRADHAGRSGPHVSHWKHRLTGRDNERPRRQSLVRRDGEEGRVSGSAASRPRETCSCSSACRSTVIRPTSRRDRTTTSGSRSGATSAWSTLRRSRPRAGISRTGLSRSASRRATFTRSPSGPTRTSGSRRRTRSASRRSVGLPLAGRAHRLPDELGTRSRRFLNGIAAGPDGNIWFTESGPYGKPSSLDRVNLTRR